MVAPKDVEGWKPNDWNGKVRYARPSGGGSLGVVFVWCVPQPDYDNPGTASFVIKPSGVFT